MESDSENSGNVSPPVPPRPPKRNKPYSVNEELAKTISSELNSRLSVLKGKNGSDSATTPSRISETQYDVKSPPPVPPRRENLTINYEETDDIIGDYENNNLNEYEEESENENNNEIIEESDNRTNDNENELNTYSENELEGERKKSNEELLNDKIEDLAEENNELIENIRELKRSLKDKKEDIKKLNSENKKQSKEISELKNNKDEQVQKLKEKVNELKEKLEELTEKNKKLESENDSLKNKIKEMSRKKSEEIKNESNEEVNEIPPKPVKPESIGSGRSLPVTPPKPSKNVCKSMIQNANTDEYDLEPIRKSSQNLDEKKSDSLELLPGTSSRPLVLPTKTCVRKRGNNRSSVLSPSQDRRLPKKPVTSNLTEEPENLNDNNDDNVDNHEKEKSSKYHHDSNISEGSSRSTERPALPPRSSERTEKHVSVDKKEFKSQLDKIVKPVRQDSPVPQTHVNNDLHNPKKKRSYIYEVSTIDSVESIDNKNSVDETEKQQSTVATPTSTTQSNDEIPKRNSKVISTSHIQKTNLDSLDMSSSENITSQPAVHETVKRHSQSESLKRHSQSRKHEEDNNITTNIDDEISNNGKSETEEEEDVDKNESHNESEEENKDEVNEEVSTPVEPEISSTLSKIQRIGRGMPSILPEGGLSNIKLRSRKEDNRSLRQCGGENLDENGLKKWIFESIGKEEKDGNLFTVLHDGSILCELINSIRKDKQIQPKAGRMRAWHIVNINAYLSGCIDLHLKTLFKAEDLYEEEGLDKIIKNLNELKYYFESKK